MKSTLVALALIGLAGTVQAPAAHAQVLIQAPVVAPGYPGDYWRHREGEDWRRRAEFRAEEERRMEWRRAHCVRDYHGQEFCRR